MSALVYLRCPTLGALGFEHGFGTLRSDRRLPRGTSVVTQVHGTRLVRAPTAPGVEADALYTDVPGHAVAVRTADCVPILLADEHSRSVVAVHAGWRGSAAGIARLAVEALRDTEGVHPRTLVAVIGPHICASCYEVDQVVRDALADERALCQSDRPGHYKLDLFALNRAQLEEAGVGRVLRLDACTLCDDRFPSHRRDGTRARAISYVRMPAQ